MALTIYLEANNSTSRMGGQPKVIRIIAIVGLCLAVLPVPARPADSTDILKQALGEVGFTKDDLGYQPKGYWNRFPLDIPHRLSSFDDLFAQPLRLYDYARVMSNTVETYLDPAYADSASDGLYKLVYNLGVDKKLGGFRSYSANLLPPPPGDTPLEVAIERLFDLGGRSSDIYTFGNKSPGIDPRAEIREKTAALPDTVRTILAALIVNIGDVITWRNKALRNCDREALERVMTIRDLADTQADGQVYYPQFDDIAATIDRPSMHYAALKAAAALEAAEQQLKPFTDAMPADFAMEMNTPFGRIAIFSDTYTVERVGSVGGVFSSLRPSVPGYFEYDATGALLIIDFGRRSIWQGSAAATTSLAQPVSLLLDMGGDDYYGHDRNTYPASAGVGLCGIGMVLDSEGNDTYNGAVYSQGVGVFGVGVLLDRNGDDSYNAALSAQGCGYFGIGLCLDATGDDKFYLHGDGQGMGGVGGGIGVLACYDGDDKYTAEPYSAVIDRGDYHSENKINGNSAQGAGFGRRGDGSDGHSWAGGLGAIIDNHGDDHYYSGNWTLGVGYWFATGIAIDRSGNDIYESCYFTQGSGAHFCNGILVDEAGDDRHELYETAGAALGFGWDFTNALLINKGGNDYYRAGMISMGLAQIRSSALLIDIGGDDEYELGISTDGLGEATWREGYHKPLQLTPYYYYANSFGGFIDIGGDDRYWQFDDDSRTKHPIASNNRTWLQPSDDHEKFGGNNYGVGIDIDSGTIPELFMWDE